MSTAARTPSRFVELLPRVAIPTGHISQLELEIESKKQFDGSVSVAERSDDLCDVLEQSLSVSSRLPKQPETVGIWGIDYHAVTMDQTLDYIEQIIHARQPSFVVTANLNYAMLCSKYPRLQAFTQRAALVLCDGMPALWRSKSRKTKIPERVTGADLIYRLSERCAAKKLRVYFYGASEGVAEKAATKLKQLYPNLIVAGVQSPLSAHRKNL